MVQEDFSNDEIERILTEFPSANDSRKKELAAELRRHGRQLAWPLFCRLRESALQPERNEESLEWIELMAKRKLECGYLRNELTSLNTRLAEVNPKLHTVLEGVVVELVRLGGIDRDKRWDDQTTIVLTQLA